MFSRPAIEDYFTDIYGLTNIKQTLADACKAKESVAILLWGPPQSAKTLLLEAIAKYFNFNGGVPFTLDRATPVGLAELFSYRYKAYVFDEIDKAKSETLRVFNEAVEHKRVSFLKHKTSIVVKLREDTKFFVGANSLSVLGQKVPEVVSRFLDIPLPPMTLDYFKEIVYLLLSKKDYTRQQTDYISSYAWNLGFRDVRKIRELGKIYPGGRVGDIIRFIYYWSKTKEELTQRPNIESIGAKPKQQSSPANTIEELKKAKNILDNFLGASPKNKKQYY